MINTEGIKQPHQTCIEQLISINIHINNNGDDRWIDGMLNYWLNKFVVLSRDDIYYQEMMNRIDNDLYLMIIDFCLNNIAKQSRRLLVEALYELIVEPKLSNKD